jgi:hypothetical protein
MIPGVSNFFEVCDPGTILCNTSCTHSDALQAMEFVAAMVKVPLPPTTTELRLLAEASLVLLYPLPSDLAVRLVLLQFLQAQLPDPRQVRR